MGFPLRAIQYTSCKHSAKCGCFIASGPASDCVLPAVGKHTAQVQHHGVGGVPQRSRCQQRLWQDLYQWQPVSLCQGLQPKSVFGYVLDVWFLVFLAILPVQSTRKVDLLLHNGTSCLCNIFQDVQIPSQGFSQIVCYVLGWQVTVCDPVQRLALRWVAFKSHR